MRNLDSIWKIRDITLTIIVYIVKAFFFPTAMHRCESWTTKKVWATKNWHLQIVVLEKTLESPLDSNKIKPVNPKRNQPWTFIGRTDNEAEALILWPPNKKNWLIGKDPDAGNDWRLEEKGTTTEDELVGWHHVLNGQEFEQTPGHRGQGNPACCSPWSLKESDTIEWLNSKANPLTHLSLRSFCSPFVWILVWYNSPLLTNGM